MNLRDEVEKIGLVVHMSGMGERQEFIEQRPSTVKSMLEMGTEHSELARHAPEAAWDPFLGSSGTTNNADRK